ncbi:hypothetical protein [Nitrosospira multiformis]|uniref:LTXXQ motif family protein n=1 Tax=Nitrosospira multiformis TaxID=1231 RepID=A0A1I7GXZ7_9PROT|nr:hypothetical protein [Nitrosospira multiformis]SFU53302.1 hypothetical protein SAMN05216417_10677 [Nitrosospira multiformis]
MKPIILALLLLFSGVTAPVYAQAAPDPNTKPDPRLAQLEIALNHLSQEQQAVYQQFQMIQELRRNEIQDSQPLTMQGYLTMGGVKDAPPASYDDNIRLQRERTERIQQYTRDLSQLYARYAELGNQKRALLDQLTELAQQTQAGR